MTEKFRRLCEKNLTGKMVRHFLASRELQTVSMKKLMLQSVPLTTDPVVSFAAVFIVAHKRMPFRGKMRADLMGPSCNKPDLQKRDHSVISQWSINRLNGQSAIFLFSVYCYFIIFLIFMQISSDMFFVFYNAFCQRKIVFMKSSSAKKLRQRLQSGKAFARRNDPAGIPVQTVAYGRTESSQVILCQSSPLQKIPRDIFHQRRLSAFIRLGKHSRRFIYQKDVGV